MLHHIPVSKELFRSVQDPALRDIRILHAYPRVLDLPLDLPDAPDPRRMKRGSLVQKRIGLSFESNDGRFHLLNRGITLSAFDYNYDAEAQILTLDLPEDDDDRYGILDGGHTYGTLVDSREKSAHCLDIESAEERFGGQHVHLEVLVKVHDHLADIAEARNFSVSLKAPTLAGYRGKFRWFLDAIGPDFEKHVRSSENDEQPVNILDLIQVMCAVNPNLFPANAAPLEAYKNAGKCLFYFIDDGDRYKFKKLAPVCRDVVRLYDYIRFHWKDAYNAPGEDGRRGRLAARKEMYRRERNRKAMVTYYFYNDGGPEKVGKAEEDFPVEKGFAIPAISSLRSLLTPSDDGTLHWYTNPFAFWDAHGPALVQTIMRASEQVGSNPHVVGRDPQVYVALYTQVRAILIDKLLEEKKITLPF